jgi:hypothetical protein
MLGKHHTAETKAKINYKRTKEHRNEISARMLGNTNNPKLRKTGKDHPASKLKSEEHKRKISEAIRKKWQEKKQCG